MDTEIKLFELARNRYGLMISPMIQDFMLHEAAADTFDPHRHDYYSMFLLKTGNMTLRLDSELISMQHGSVILIGPGQVHHMLTATDNTGWVIAFDAKLIDKHARNALQSIKVTNPSIRLHETELSVFDNLMQMICREANDSQARIFQSQLLNTLINACFYKMISLYESNANDAESNYLSRSAEITLQFKHLLVKNFVKIRKPSAYATLLNISVSHLNDVVKMVTGFNTSYFIHQELMAEAQRQLLYSTKNIEEIADMLGYEDSKYFTRLFTKTIGQAPSQFRKANNSNRRETGNRNILVFKTDIISRKETRLVINELQQHLPDHAINIDLQDSDRILRIDGPSVSPGLIVELVSNMNHHCAELGG